MKFSRILLTSAALLALSLGSANAAEVKKIGLAVANLQANFFNQIKQAVEAEAKTRGIAVVTVDAKGDGPTQVNQIQDLLTQNIDALIYIPAGAAAATVPVKLASQNWLMHVSPMMNNYSNRFKKCKTVIGRSHVRA